jgi:diguanylate cyclase (GGDEF)-like protein
MKLSERSGAPLCVALIDLDHFKHINDQQGHHVGDEVLGALARTLREGLRTTDLLARWGGEEFLVVLPDAAAEAAQTVLHRMLDQLTTLAISSTHPALRVSFSAGVAQWRAGEDLTAVLQRADQSLYDAKAQGRHRVLIAA